MRSHFLSHTILLPLLAGFLFAFRSDCDQVPVLNQKVVDFVKREIGHKVGRGECWDLAAGALYSAGAKWDGQFGFGRKVDFCRECVYAGDIIQFTNVKVTYQKGNLYYEEEMTQHTAVIYDVKKKGSYVVAEQNTNKFGRRVGLNDFDAATVRSGKFEIFRPLAYD